MATLTQRIKICATALGVAMAFVSGTVAPSVANAQSKVSFDVGEMQSLRRAASLLDRGDFDRAAAAYRDLADAAGTSQNLRVVALEGEAFALAADLRAQVDAAQGDSRKLRLLKLDRRSLLAHLDRVKPQADTQILAYIRAAANEENALTVASFQGHPFEQSLLWIEENPDIAAEQPPIVAVVPKPPKPVVPEPNTSSRNAGTYVAGSNINVREGPGTNFAVMGQLKGGEKVKVDTDLIGPDNKRWYQLSGNRGYVRSSLLSLATQVPKPREPAPLPQTTDTTNDAPKRDKPAPAAAPKAAAGPTACSGPAIGSYRLLRVADIYYSPGGKHAARLNVGFVVNNATGISGGHLIFRKSDGGGKFSCRYLSFKGNAQNKVVIKLN
ncbi:MAG: SH3 domain-containing protein [Paracoccaceae bacterium]|jgi:hypothetical protein